MAKFSGLIGYAEANVEVKPGVFVEKIVERPYRGDVVRNSRQLREADQINDDITVNNSISIVADQYAMNHIFAMRFVEWAGTLWSVTDVDVQSPRLILRLGGVYHGKRAGETP